MARKIVITSGKGGVGKTTVTANLGLYLSEQGLRVALIDADLGLNNLDMVVGVEKDIVFDLKDIIEGRCRVKQALVQGAGHKNLYVLSSNNFSVGGNFTGQNLKIVVDSLDGTFDYVLLDCPAGIDGGFHRAVSCADEAIIVATPTMASLRDADKVLSIMKSYGLDSVKIVLNKVRGDLILDNKMLDPSSIENLLKTEVIGVIPEEDEVFLSCGYGISKKSRSGKAIKILTDNIIKGKKKLYDTTKKYNGFFGSIKRGLKRSV